jgi:hypothetical protein
MNVGYYDRPIKQHINKCPSINGAVEMRKYVNFSCNQYSSLIKDYDSL